MIFVFMGGGLAGSTFSYLGLIIGVVERVGAQATL